ncbi:competence/damage-inducible protein A [Rhodospirillum rubrum]|nr:molybdopterin-binding protein [Rhodospirillum rubrum]MBK1663731.1 competence/damage-inducible protein A [Rhodospirillum rubrum]MBK1676482.1 competence/damage-inducible protein A [Rhodospirillum rubrum]
MSTPASPPTAAILVIGNEILSGRTQDANSGWLAARLAEIGIPVREIRVIPDNEAVIVEAVNALRAQARYVFTTGGIGPTHDDITSASIAAAFGVRLLRHPEAERRLRAHYQAVGSAINAARLRMAEIPEGATLIDNPVSVAPGFRLDNVHVLAGVPSIMRAMWDSLRPGLIGGPPVRSVSVTALVREGDMAAGLGALQNAHPGVDIGSYPFMTDGRIGASIVVRGTDETLVALVGDKVADLLRALGSEPEITADA